MEWRIGREGVGFGWGGPQWSSRRRTTVVLILPPVVGLLLDHRASQHGAGRTSRTKPNTFKARLEDLKFKPHYISSAHHIHSGPVARPCRGRSLADLAFPDVAEPPLLVLAVVVVVVVSCIYGTHYSCGDRLI
ncbi:hypothetical protein Sjap_014915 [Stephania japonica]|uniref:Uncharacterized protein n=1 Tax=Stephania japonica TaxID=461633 RepID=A0AAP0IJ82_9MAGN